MDEMNDLQSSFITMNKHECGVIFLLLFSREKIPPRSGFRPPQPPELTDNGFQAFA